MTSTQLLRSAQAVVVALTIAMLALPALALAGAHPGQPAPDWFERYVAAHPFGQDIVQQPRQTPDWFERFAATHPFGHRFLAANTTVGPHSSVFVDDWFRDPVVAVVHVHRLAVGSGRAFFVDDWFRDPS